ncbi:uncharacterized protein VTP21DRAFT_10717 [Calcarisporiella thermophila]|uniref:uncharacterized protein n=1 Tax=Calcarisporiella thermophila TaxID=911321 RepID=UPI00374206A8
MQSIQRTIIDVDVFGRDVFGTAGGLLRIISGVSPDFPGPCGSSKVPLYVVGEKEGVFGKPYGQAILVTSCTTLLLWIMALIAYLSGGVRIRNCLNVMMYPSWAAGAGLAPQSKTIQSGACQETSAVWREGMRLRVIERHLYVGVPGDEEGMTPSEGTIQLQGSAKEVLNHPVEFVVGNREAAITISSSTNLSPCLIGWQEMRAMNNSESDTTSPKAWLGHLSKGMVKSDPPEASYKLE